VNLAFAPQAWEDYLHWQQSDPHIVARIRVLIKDIMRSAHSGIGKPELLKHALQGYWSRRINSEHRIVYCKSGDQILIAQLRYHY
jgi:toxin YoeB